MPGGDRTGPAGEGPMTGRQLGYCAGNDRMGSYYPRRGFGRGLGYGRGFRRGFGARFGQVRGGFWKSSDSDVSREVMLEREVESLRKQLSSLEEKLSKLSDES